MTISVRKLREKLEDVLNRLCDLEDDEEIRMVSNTYFLGPCHLFLGLSGYDGGYVNLDELPKAEEEDE